MCENEGTCLLDALELACSGTAVGHGTDLVGQRALDGGQANAGGRQRVQQRDAGMLVARVARHRVGRVGNPALHQVCVEARRSRAAQDVTAGRPQRTWSATVKKNICLIRVQQCLKPHTGQACVTHLWHKVVMDSSSHMLYALMCEVCDARP